MTDVFKQSIYIFPYSSLHFPGQNTGEKILFITRESPIMLRLRMVGLFVFVSLIFILGSGFVSFFMGESRARILLVIIILVVSGMISVIGYLWIKTTYSKSLFIITTRRLTKIIYTTPFNWYQFSLGLDEIADTGSYSSSYFEALFGLGYFVARSGAAAIKNFKIVNITFAADLHNYVNKLLFAYKQHPVKIDNFRPFIPNLKGDARKKLLEDYPHYTTEF